MSVKQSLKEDTILNNEENFSENEENVENEEIEEDEERYLELDVK